MSDETIKEFLGKDLTVGELIEVLKTLPKDSKIFYDDYKNQQAHRIMSLEKTDNTYYLVGLSLSDLYSLD